MGIVGKFVFFTGKDFHQMGEVVDQVGEHALIRWDRLSGSPCPGDLASVLVPLSAMATKPGKDASPAWEFFPTREAMEAFHRWIDLPPDAVDEPERQSPKLN